MPIFEYKGYVSGGKNRTGVIDADSPKVARAKLRKQGILVTSVEPDSGRSVGGKLAVPSLESVVGRVSFKDVSGFTRQLATLQTAALPLIESLDALFEQASNVRFKKVIADIREQVSYGETLADAMAKHPKYFDVMYTSLVRAGEASGSLGHTLNELAAFQENRRRQRTKIAAAMIYPAIMTVVGSAVLLFLLGYVIPKIELMFEDMNQALPLPTVILLAVSNFLANWWPALVLLIIIAVIAFAKYYRTDRGRDMIDRLSLRLPVFGPIIQASAISRFAGSLNILISGGVGLLEAMKITENAVGNSAIAGAISDGVVNITEGETIAEPLKASGHFPPLVTQMLASGEKSGSLEFMLGKIAEAYDFEVETAVSALTALIDPILILVMGATVGFIVLAILLPIFELSQYVQ